ncbi:helix-turn-helix domain-containing protein [Streptomyces sp. NPDC057909]|uniref:helix-turn-helix domain-containing protein n=1 Tax=Streptomyces sp. NPDC057909 TaxID=3346277 RepID=UPI0036EBD53D
MSPIEARIRERHAAIHALLAQGHSIREIARELHMGGNTVRRTARAASPEELTEWTTSAPAQSARPLPASPG